MDDREHILAGLRRHWLTGLPKAVVEAVADAARLRVEPPRAILFRKGEAARGLFLILAGAVRFSRSRADGSEMVTRIERVGEMAGELTVLAGRGHSHDARCVSACRLIHIAPADLLRLLDSHPSLTLHLLRRTATRLQQNYDDIEDALLLNTEQRLARRLLSLGDGGTGDGGGAVAGDGPIAVTQEELARMVGCTRQNLHQTLAAWQRAAYIRQGYGCVTILDRAALLRITAT